MENENKYQLKEPMYYKGENVKFLSSKGGIYFGKIVDVTTHYSPSNKGIHIYRIERPNYVTIMNIPEKQILNKKFV